MIGSYKVKKLVKLSYRLELPHTMKIHNVFHPNLLWKEATDHLFGQQNSPPSPTVIDDEKEWEVNNILDIKQSRGSKKVLYCVNQKGYNDDKAWYNAINFDYAKDVVDDFYKQNSSKPR